jgi:hypothetical protein
MVDAKALPNCIAPTKWTCCRQVPIQVCIFIIRKKKGLYIYSVTVAATFGNSGRFAHAQGSS